MHLIDRRRAVMGEQEQSMPAAPAENIPRPADSGVAGTQNSAPADVVVAGEVAPFERVQPLTRGIGGIASRHPRAFGSEINTEIVAAIAQHFEHIWTEANAELRSERAELAKAKDDLQAALIENARLETELRMERDHRQRRNLAIALGSGLIGVGLNMPLGQTSVIPIVLGSVLVIANWVPFTAVADWLRKPRGSK